MERKPTAVFPTPGLPSSNGLFFRRRQSTCWSTGRGGVTATSKGGVRAHGGVAAVDPQAKAVREQWNHKQRRRREGASNGGVRAVYTSVPGSTVTGGGRNHKRRRCETS